MFIRISAVCERCGAIGVKHTFYTKSRRFCSMACARGELYSLVVNNKTTSGTSQLQHQQQQIENMENNTNENQLQEQQQQTHQQQQNDVELALRVAHIKNSNYRFRITDQSKITQINGFGEPVNNNNSNITTDSNEITNGVSVVHEGDSNNEMLEETAGNTTTLTLPSGIYTTDNQQLTEMAQTPKALRMYRDVMPQDEMPQIPKYDRLPSSCPQMEKIISIRRKLYDPTHSYDWTPRLGREDFFAAPVTCFNHAPGFDVWDNLGIDMKVEVENTDCDQLEVIQPGQTPHSFWVATILDIQGYKALMRYEGENIFITLV